MWYLSTRGGVSPAQFEDVLLAGLAADGGLYMPEIWPRLEPCQIAAFAAQPYAEAAAEIVSRFTGKAFDRDRLLEIATDVYGRFAHRDAAPITRLGEGDYLLELFYGPTLAFKDFAMQLLGALFGDVLKRRSARLTIIVATSGDTGAAAIEALKTCDRVNLVVLHPHGRITETQRRMMTTVDAENVLNIAIDGSFDDCQAIVKQLFADRDFARAVSLGGVNSINWARLAAQTVYYFTAYASVAKPGERISFVVPTGNFGDALSGYIAKKMGLPIEKIAVATNQNDILHRAMTTGDYTPHNVQPSSSPSMDIQIASNFERLLYEINERDAKAVRKKMELFGRSGSMMLTENERAAISADFVSHSVTDTAVREEIARHWKEHNLLIDPHTAVGQAAARILRKNGALGGKIVTLATAHPAKFPDTVKAATGIAPDLPDRYADLYGRPERTVRMASDKAAVKAAILEQAKASQ